MFTTPKDAHRLINEIVFLIILQRAVVCWPGLLSGKCPPSVVGSFFRQSDLSPHWLNTGGSFVGFLGAAIYWCTFFHQWFIRLYCSGAVSDNATMKSVKGCSRGTTRRSPSSLGLSRSFPFVKMRLKAVNSAEVLKAFKGLIKGIRVEGGGAREALLTEPPPHPTPPSGTPSGENGALPQL